ncbi:multidrug-resistance type transporter aminotriazole resistance [Xanthoria calcicola]
MHHHDAFDHALFGLSPREAIYVDPQQRLLLETVYRAVEASGYLRTHKKEAGDNVCVYIGKTSADYLSNTSSHGPSAYTSTGTVGSFLCGRISHYSGWTGPSEVLDRACSSSLVAINRACKAIQHGESSLALAGGVNVINSIDNYLDLAKAGFLSTIGQCNPFLNDADGYCRVEGVGLVFLKALDQALRENDQILGVVCGSASNQGGLSPSITIPHSPTQIALYCKTLDQARISPHDVSYVEAHGTGT